MPLARPHLRSPKLAHLPLLALCAALAGSALVPPPAQAAARRAFVQKRDVEIRSGGSASVAFARPNKAGNLIVVYVVWDNGDPVSLTDSRGNTYASAGGPTQSPSDSTNSQIFYASDVAGGANTVTASFATPIASRAALYVHEYSEIAPVAPFDAAVAASGTSAVMDSGRLRTGTCSALVFVGATSDGRSITRLTRGVKVRGRRRGELTADTFAGSAGSFAASALQSGTGWTLQLAAFQYVGPTPKSRKHPVGVSDNGRYLVDQNCNPFLITGDSPQALMVNLSESQADAFFADRKRLGFNTLWINLLCGTYTGGRPDASTFDGIRPFTNDFDLSTPNEAYFKRVDRFLRLAARRGITVLLDPAETGSFLGVLGANGVDGARAYGRYLGARYRAFDNIIWMSGNDFQDYQDPAADAVVQAVALGIQDVDERHIHTVELNLTGSLEDPSWAPIIQLNASYTYLPTYAQVLADYNRNAMPTFMVEANYEFEHEAENEPTPEILRRQAYWSLLSGATGQMYGNKYTWPFLAGWQSHLDTPGAIQMGYVKRLFESRRWFELVPDQSHSVVTAGYGTFLGGASVGTSDYVTAARTPDGSLVMAYLPTMPSTGFISVDMSQLAAPAKASWYDPSRGTFAKIAGSPFDNSGTQDFTPPGPNRDGDGDWVLVLEVP